MILELILQPFLRFNGLGKHQKAGRLAIEPVHDEEFFRSFFIVQISAQESVSGSCPFRFRRHREKSRWFVDNNHRIVFEHDWDLAGHGGLLHHDDQRPADGAKQGAGDGPGAEILRLNQEARDHRRDDLRYGHQRLH